MIRSARHVAAALFTLGIIGLATTSAAAQEVVDPEPVDIPLRIESGGVAGFEDFVMATLNDSRSWSSAGFRFGVDPTSRYRVVLAEPAEADRLCLPLRTHGTLSCQNGPVVALNADRWRNGTSDWDSTLVEYRRYMVNHEVGHLIGQRHPTPRCPVKGTAAAVMEQQTKGLEGCSGSAWPLWWEIERATNRPAVLAPTPDWQPKPTPKNLGGAVDPPSTTAPPPENPTTTAPEQPLVATLDNPEPLTRIGADATSTTTTTPPRDSSTEIAARRAENATQRVGNPQTDRDSRSTALPLTALIVVLVGVLIGLINWQRPARR